MTRRIVLVGRVCVLVLAVAALVPALNLNALPFPNGGDNAGNQEATASNSPVFLVAPSLSVGGRPAAIVAGDLNGDGTTDLVVANAQTGNVDVLLGDGKGKFQTPVHYKIGGSPVALVLGDLAGRGKIDIAVADRSGNSVSVLLGKGDGTFQTAVTYTVGTAPSALAIGDFAGNGHGDLLVANAGSNTLAVLTNRGDGTFQSAKFYSVTASPLAIAIADFNGDGKLDVASGNADGTVNILLGDGTGRLNVAATMTLATRVSALVVGDFNRDGKSDLAVADSVASTVSIFLGRGDGTFQSSSVLAVGNEPVSLALEDVDADGVPDLLVVNKSSNTVGVMLGARDGTFQARAEYVVGNSPLAVAIADFNGNGHLDLATANSADGTVSVPQGNGDGTFQAAQNYRTHLEHKSVAVGDLDGDGHADLVVASVCGNDSKCGGNGTASVFLSDGKGALKPASIYALGKGPISIALADVNGDKKLDLIAVNRDDGTVMVLLGNGDGTFQEGIAYSAGSRPVSVSVGDFNRDGKADLAIVARCGSAGCEQQGSVNVLFGNGDGSFKSGPSYDVGFSPAAVTVGDLDGDGELDLVVANSCGRSAACSNGTASVLLGDGKGSFTLKTEVDLGKQASSIVLADLNQDGKLDLIAANSADNQVGVLLGNGDGTFRRQVPYAVGVGPSAVVVADFDGDGHPDVAVANLKNSTVSLLHGNGDGTLRTAVAYPVGFGPQALAALDLTSSDRLALVTANGNSGGSPVGNDITLLANAGAVPSVTSTSTAVGSSLNPSVFGQSVTFTATVTPTPDGGTVTFVSGATTLCSSVAVSTTNGKATCPYSALSVGTDPITVVYNADTNFGGSTGTLSGGQTVNQANSATAVSSSVNPSVFGQAVTFSTTVSAIAPGSGTPTGQAQLVIDAVNVGGPVTLAAGSASFPAISTLTNGPHTVAVKYLGDSNFATSTGNLPTQTVGKAASATAVSSSVNPSAFGQAVTFSATVSAVAPGAGTPTGQVQLVIDGANVGSAVSLVAGSASFPSISTLSTGPHTVAVNYLGDSNFATSTGNLPTQTVGKAASATAVSSSVNPSAFGQAVTFSATVSAVAPGAGTPTGQVQLVIDGANVGSAVSLVAGSASFPSISTLSTGPHTVAVNYLGDSNFATSTGNLPTQTVGKAGTKTTVISSLNPSIFNQVVTFTATVSVVPPGAGTSTGTVTFTSGSTTLCTVTLSSGTAACPYGGLPGLPVPTDTVTATYNGDTNFAISSGTVTQTVNQATTTTALTAAPNPSSVNQSVTLAAAVTGQYGGTPTGTVIFTYGSTTLCTVPLTSAAATCSSAVLPVGSDTVTASYSGDSNFISSTGTVAQTVNRTVTTTGYTYVVNLDQTISFTATVSLSFTGVYVPNNADTVTFMDGAVSLGIGTLNPTTLQATFSTAAPLSAGTHSITAVYSGDTNFLPSTSAATSFTFSAPASPPTVISGAQSAPITLTPNGFSSGATVTFSCLSISGTGITGFLGPNQGQPGIFSPPSPASGQPFVSCYFGSLHVTAPATTTLTVCTAIPAAAGCTGILGVMRPDMELKPRSPLYSLAIFLPGIVFLGIGTPLFIRLRHRKPSRKSLIGVMGILLLVSLLLLSPACGGGFSAKVVPIPPVTPGDTQPGTYTLTILGTGTDGSVEVYDASFVVSAPQ